MFIVIQECNGNRTQTARRLGIDRSNLLMKRLGIES